MNRVIEIMMKCIKAEIFGCKVDLSDFDDVSAGEWEQVLSLSKKHDLAHIVGNFLQKNGLISDPAIASYIKNVILSVFHRFCVQENELNAIKKMLEEEKIPFVVLKGPVIRKLYPEEWMRTSCDIDVLVKESALEKAKKLLEEKLGYTVKDRNYHDVDLYAPSGVHLELHFSILEHQENIDVLLKKAWKYTEYVKKGGAEKRFAPEFMIFHVVSHLQYHFIAGGCGVKPFVDLKILLEKTEYDSSVLKEMLKTAGIEQFFEKVVLLSEIWFGNAKRDDTTYRFEEYVLKGGVYGVLENRVLASQSKSGKTASFMQRVFMSHESLSIRYSHKKIKKWQLPYYQIVRWIDLVKEGSFHKGMQELKLQATTQKEEVDEIQQMMKDLGLQK